MLSKYGVARHVYIPIVKASSANFAVGADWTPAAGDVKISKDGGAAANVTNLPTAIAMGNAAMWDFSLTATEMQAALVVVTVADSATKAVEDQAIVIETYGHASAQHEFDLDTATQAVTVASGGLTAASIATDAIDNDAIAANAVTELQSGLATASALADVQSDTNDIQARLPAALVGGRMDSSVGAMAANVMTAAAAAADLATELQSGIATQASVDLLATAANLATVAGYIDTEVASILAAVDTEVAAIKAKTDNLPASPAATGDIPTAAVVADAVWDEATAGHTTSGTFGEQLKTDVDAILVDTAEIGAAGAGLTALASQASVNTIDDFVDTEVAAIKAKTDLIPAAPAAVGDIPTAGAIADAVLDESLTELAAVPSAAPTLRAALQWLYQVARNKVTTTSTQTKVHNDAGTAIGTASVSDDGTTFTRDEYA